MSIFNLIAMYLGYAVIAVLAFLLAYIIKELAVGFARACSLTRFYMAVARKSGIDLEARKFPKFFLSQWWQLTGTCPTIQGPGGYWNGIGDWKARKESRRV